MAARRQLEELACCEYLRDLEEAGQIFSNRTSVEQQLRARQLPIQQALVERARLLVGEQFFYRLDSLKRQARAVSAGVRLLLFIGGAMAAVQLFSAVQQASANFFSIFLGLLGFHMVALLLWLAALWTKAGAQLQGSWVYQIQQSLARWGGIADEVLLAWRRAMAQSGCLRWQLSLLSHAMWLAFLLGALLSAWLMLSTRQYNFVWETTILDAEWFVQITGWLAFLPQQLGIAVPGAAEVLDSRLGGAQSDADTLRRLWSNLLLSSLMFYGLLPRAVVFLISALALRNCAANATCDLRAPYYFKVARRLSPLSQHQGVVDGDDRPHQESGAAVVSGADWNWLQDASSVCLYGLEWGGAWPPQLDLPKTLSVDSGFDVRDRASRAELLQRLQGGAEGQVLLVARANNCPDRGTLSLLREAVVLAPSLHVLLAGGAVDEAVLSSWLGIFAELGLDGSRLLLAGDAPYAE